MISEKIILTPFSIVVDNVVVDVLEVLKTRLISGDEYYHVVARVNYKDIKSRSFTLDVKSMDELIIKLKVEVNKIKYIEYVYGINELRRLLT
ncbi:MAG: hypothetical protein QXV82_09185 [Ignisphaera sp.]